MRPKGVVRTYKQLKLCTRFLVNAAKSTSARQNGLSIRLFRTALGEVRKEGLCRNAESKSRRGRYDPSATRPPPFQGTPSRLAIIRFGTSPVPEVPATPPYTGCGGRREVFQDFAAPLLQYDTFDLQTGPRQVLASGMHPESLSYPATPYAGRSKKGVLRQD